jgi:hypothetical protein
MSKQVLQILSGFGLILVLTRCAQIGQLSGGKKDVTPPKLVEAMPFNYRTHFNMDEIVLRFDEFIQIKDLSSQLIISPRLKTTPEIIAEGKKIRITLKKEELMPGTTYRFYFGRSIADMNESNSIPDFEYVFSTGAYIDSLKVKGTVTDAFNNKSSPSILVGLYYEKKSRDSLPYVQEPDYFARTNDNGEFDLKYLPYTTFKVFAFSDKNKNGVYDGESEKVAFLESDLKLLGDTTIRLRLFQEEPSKSFIKRTASPYYGFTQLFLNKKSKVEVSALNAKENADISQMDRDKEKDTISLYYKGIRDTLGLVIHNFTSGKADTLKLPIPKNNPGKKRLKSYSTNISGNKLVLDNKIKITFLNWMDTTRRDLSRIRLSSKEDSLISTLSLTGAWINITTFEIENTLKQGVNYSLRIDTNAFFDINQFTNDSSMLQFRTESKAEFGKLTLKLRLNKKQSYVIQLINEQEKVIKERDFSFSLSSSNAVSLDFTDIPPGVYSAKIVFDDNKNKKWDSGSLNRKQQPEKVIIHSKRLKVLPDWEIEEEILIKE